MRTHSSVAVIGLGLMGGSLARDLSARGLHVVGYDARPEVVEQARRAEAVHEVMDDSLSRAADTDLVILATPVDVAIEKLYLLRGTVGGDTLITDLGSTKAAIVDTAEALGLGNRFVGAHPLTGDHRSGWAATRTGLYEGAPVFICPAPSASELAIASIVTFWTQLGGRCIHLAPDEHDRRMAWVSHLPQVTASAVASALSRAGYSKDQLGPGGRDVTRLAASSPEMWRAIVLSNADPLKEALAQLRQRILAVEEALERQDATALEHFFDESRRWSESG